jgi:hypothetical protein
MGELLEERDDFGVGGEGVLKDRREIDLIDAGGAIGR